MRDARPIIDQLGLSPHPEGGWYVETWRSDVTIAGAEGGERASATAIYFLLESHQHSAWHRVDASEIWLWHMGDPLLVSQKRQHDGEPHSAILGPDLAAGQRPQFLVPAHQWQATTPLRNGAIGWTLVSCIVSPGFEFAGFELAG